MRFQTMNFCASMGLTSPRRRMPMWCFTAGPACAAPVLWSRPRPTAMYVDTFYWRIFDELISLVDICEKLQGIVASMAKGGRPLIRLLCLTTLLMLLINMPNHLRCPMLTSTCNKLPLCRLHCCIDHHNGCTTDPCRGPVLSLKASGAIFLVAAR